jgi:hypothetical protein
MLARGQGLGEYIGWVIERRDVVMFDCACDDLVLCIVIVRVDVFCPVIADIIV